MNIEKAKKLIDTHRAESIICCEETCWCWEMERLIDEFTALSEPAESQSDFTKEYWLSLDNKAKGTILQDAINFIKQQHDIIVERESEIDRLEAEKTNLEIDNKKQKMLLNSYEKVNQAYADEIKKLKSVFCEAHVPLDIDPPRDCYACELIKIHDENNVMKNDLIGYGEKDKQGTKTILRLHKINDKLAAENKKLKEALEKIIQADKGCKPLDEDPKHILDSCDVMVNIAHQALKGDK